MQRHLRSSDYLGHMLDAIRLARSYVEGLSKDDFLADRTDLEARLAALLAPGGAPAQ